MLNWILAIPMVIRSIIETVKMLRDSFKNPEDDDKECKK